MRIIQRPKVRRGRHRLAASSAADALQPQSPSAVDQHHQPSSPGEQQQPTSAAQTPQPSSAATAPQPPSAAKTPQLRSAATEQQSPSAAKPPQLPSAATEQQPPSAANTLQLPSAAKQLPSAAKQQPPSAGEKPQPLSDQHQPLSAGEKQSLSAAKQHQPPSASESPQLPLHSPGVSHQQPSPAVKHQPLSSASADHFQPPSAGEQQQEGVLQTINKLRSFNHSLSLFLSTFDALSEHPNPVSTFVVAAASQDPNKPEPNALSEHPNGVSTPVSVEASQYPNKPEPNAPSEYPNGVSTSAAVAAEASQYPNKTEPNVLLEHPNGVSTFIAAEASQYPDKQEPNTLSEHPNGVSTSVAAKASQYANKPDPNGATILASPIPELETTVLASPLSELDTSCRSWVTLRKYVTTRLSDVDKLRAEVPAALQRAPDSARVVLNCISGGRYHLDNFINKVTQGRVCILILEFYLSGCFPTQHELIRGKIVSNAVRIALEWREKIICKGGIVSAGAVDALGLVLFLGSFVVPKEFSLEDLCELLLLSKSEKEVHVLRRSPFLLEKMPGAINYMSSKDMHVEAVDIVFLFGLEERYDPLSMLSCVLHKAKQVSEEEMRDEQLSLISVKELNEKYLTVLESVARCLEVHKLDSSGFDFNIEQRITMLRKKNVEIVQKLKERNIKRNAEEAGPLYAPETLSKRPRPSATELPVVIPGI